MIDYKRIYKRIKHFVQPSVEIGGLEISDAHLLYLSVRPYDNKVTQVSVAMPLGALKEGVVVNKDLCIRALQQLRSQIVLSHHIQLPVIVSISDSAVYSQVFTLPLLDGASLQEAIDLNIKMITPIDLAQAYYGWEVVSESFSTHAQETEILASFVQKQTIDTLTEILSATGFIPYAIEQHSASLIRAITHLSALYDPAKIYCVLFVSSNGLSFAILRRGHLHFNLFSSWNTVVNEKNYNRQLSLEQFSNIIAQEGAKVMNYYNTRFTDAITGIFVIAPGLEKQTEAIVKSHFPSLPIEQFILRDYQIPSPALVSLGAATRGILSRASDTQISLLAEDTQTQYAHSQIITFVLWWRKIALVVGVVVIGIYALAYAFVASQASLATKTVQQTLASPNASVNLSKVAQLEVEAAAFNTLVTSAQGIKKSVSPTPIIALVVQKTEGEITLDKVSYSSQTGQLSLTGTALSHEAAEKFKKEIVSIPNVSQVDMPLSRITPATNGGVRFEITGSIGAI